ncbi:MAG TPA: cytochrome c-type biogenesis protein CcmH [Candidatus Angelobacter sp.]|nr:cytochrome c-type biogenesis protein CcmH [Candidatus Angelobacter sp.]
MKRILQALVLSCSLIFLVAADTGTDTVKDRYNTLGNKMMCACGCGQILLKCNHVGCPDSDRMTRELKSSVTAYNNDEDVLNWFRRTYGVTIVVDPATHGFELLIWLVPPILVILAVLSLVLLLRKWRRTPNVAIAGAPSGVQLEYFQDRVRKETEL